MAKSCPLLNLAKGCVCACVCGIDFMTLSHWMCRFFLCFLWLVYAHLLVIIVVESSQ